MEVIVALIIVGVAAAMGIPRIADIQSQNRVDRGTQAVQIEAQQAFAIAARNRTPVTVRWNSASVELRVTNLANTTIYRRTVLSGFGFVATDVSMSPSVVTVYPNGFASDSLVVTLSKKGHSKSVRVSRAGMVRIK